MCSARTASFVWSLLLLSACAPKPTSLLDTVSDCCSKGTVYDVPELTQAPSFPGGDAAMYAWLGNRLNRPADAAAVKEGPLVRFNVSCDGSLKDIAIKVPAHPAMDSLALQAVRDMPTWTPGKIKERAVCTLNVVQVHFD